MGLFSTMFTKKGAYIDTSRIVVKICNKYFTEIGGIKEPQNWTNQDHIELHSYIVNWRYDNNIIPGKETLRQNLLQRIRSDQSGGLSKLIYSILIAEKASLEFPVLEGFGIIDSELEKLGVPNYLINDSDYSQ